MASSRTVLETPLGSVELVVGPGGVRRLSFARGEPSAAAPPADPPTAGMRAAAARVRAYFAGDLQALEDLELDPRGTSFQRCVWRELRGIGPGQTISYGELARRLGRPGAARAVAAANARNPVALAIPCHRVVGADGSLTGYAGGLSRKRWLLEHEGARLNARASSSRSAPAHPPAAPRRPTSGLGS